MATTNNLILMGLRGKLGPLVFRQRNGKTIISFAPGKRTTPPTASQLKQAEKFKRASRLA